MKLKESLNYKELQDCLTEEEIKQYRRLLKEHSIEFTWYLEEELRWLLSELIGSTIPLRAKLIAIYDNVYFYGTWSQNDLRESDVNDLKNILGI